MLNGNLNGLNAYLRRGMAPSVRRLAFAAAFLPALLQARDIIITEPSKLNLIDGARAGDVVVFKNGTWTDVTINVTNGGDARKPLLIRAETPGAVVLSGASSLQLNAPYVTVDGLLFRKGGLTGRTSVIEFNSHHCILKNTAIIDYSPADLSIRNRWVMLGGHHNGVDHCYFNGKRNQGPVIENKDEDGRYNSITHSHFKDIPWVAKANGREIVKITGPGHVDGTSKEGAFFTLQGNLFDHADGEGVEFISIKSNFNKIIGNTAISTRGSLNIRRGSHNEITGNIILGEGLDRACGIRMSGSDNLIQGNFVSGCEFGIQVSSGEYWAKPLTAGYKVNDRDGTAENKAVYPQNKSVAIIDNTLVGNVGPDLDIGVGCYKKHWPENQNVLIPEECRIERNICVRPSGGVAVVGQIPDRNPPLNQFEFNPNIYVGNVLYGGTNNFAPAGRGFALLPPPPAETLEEWIAAFKPLTSQDVGPPWVIALRKAGHFPVEDLKPTSGPDETKKSKVNKKR